MNSHVGRCARGGAGRRGVALLIVITVLVTLVMIAVPFVLAMRHGQERTEALSAQERADFESELLLAQVKQFLTRTSYASEMGRSQSGGGAVTSKGRAAPGRIGRTDETVGTDDDPFVDSLEEVWDSEKFAHFVNDPWSQGWGQDAGLALRAKALANRKLGPMTDDRGSIWSAEAEDAQARIHVNGASPFLLANLMGSALLGEEIDGQAADIPVENVVVSKIPGAEGFPKTGGALRIGREVVRYTTFDGQTFRGCSRGAVVDAPLGLNGGPDKHKRGTPVIAYDAFQLATRMICEKPGFLTPFENLNDLRTIARWGGRIGISQARLQALEPYLTVWARRETSEWLAAQLSLEAVPKGDGTGQDEIVVRDDRGNPSGGTAYFGPGVIVRLGDGERTCYQVVDRIGDEAEGQRDRMITLAGSVGADESGIAFEGGKTRIEALAPTPVNINTASKVVLYAVMANLHLRAGDPGPETLVSPTLAWTLAERIVTERAGGAVKTQDGVRTGGPFRHAEDFGQWLKTLADQHAITTQQRWALYTNAINPHQSNLEFGTAPWCYRTLDVYHVEARVAVNDRAGNLLATAAQREVIEVGSDQAAAWTLDTQEQFEARIGMGSGGKWFATYPYGVTWSGSKGVLPYVQPPLRAPKHLREDIYPSTKTSYGDGGGRDMGDVRLAPSRVRLPGAVVLEQHFDETAYTDGYFTESHLPYTHKTQGVFMAGSSDPLPRPFSMSFWWRSYSDADWTAFDCGKTKFMNRYAVFVRDGQDGKELVFRVCGPTLEEKAAECFVPLRRIGYAQGEWYHIHVSASGEDASMMELLVDGVDVAQRTGMTYLASGVGADAGDLPVLSTTGFHQRGALKIGSEIVEYDGLNGEAFRDVIRGARGTTAHNWAEGTPVRMLGYTLPITLDVTLGGSHLTQALQKYTAVRIDNVDDQTTVQVKAQDGTVITVPIYGINSARTTFAAQAANSGDPVKPLWGQAIGDVLEAYGLKGYALMGCPKIANEANSGGGGSSEVVGGWEVVYYTRQGSNFQIQRYKATPWQTASQPYFLMTHGLAKQDNADNTWPCFLVPISVLTSPGMGGRDYLDPSNPEDEARLQRYGGDGDGRLLLGTTTPEGSNECIRYSSVDRKIAAPSILFVQDRHIANITNLFFGSSRRVNPGNPPPTDPPVPPGPTDPPTPPGPVPPTPPGGGGGGGGGPSGTPSPGGQVPPGARDPADPPPTPPDPGTGEPGGGGSDPGSGNPSGGSPGGGSTTPSEPTAPTADPGDAEGEETGGPGGGAKSGQGAEETSLPGGNKEPPGEEPPPDQSGGGGSNTSEGDGPHPPTIVAPDKTGWDDLPPSPDAKPEGLWKEPAYASVRTWTRAYFRGTNATADLEHQATGGSSPESLFIPCFRAWEGFSGSLGRRTGRNDVITLTNGLPDNPTRYQGLVRWGDPAGDWLALDHFIEGEIIEAPPEGGRTSRLDGRGRPRILKFPCTELPEELPNQIEFAQSTLTGSSVVTAFLDELFAWRHDTHPLGIVANSEGVSAEAEEITLRPQEPVVSLEGIPGHDKDCGLFSLDGELIVYRGTHSDTNNTLVLERCVRGAFGTKARSHPLGGYGRFIFDVPVSSLAGNLNRDSKSIPLVHARNWPKEGLVRILKGDTAELIHYTAQVGNELLLPGALDADPAVRDRGLFRGRFGTQTLDHDDAEVVIWQPFRHWDRYTARRTEDDRTFSGFHDHPESGFLELSKRLRGAWWKRLTWVESFEGFLRGTEGRGPGRRNDATDADTFMDVLVAVRLNPGVPWDTDRVIDLRDGDASGPGAARGDPMQSLFVFANMEGTNRLEVESETADMRIYFRYKPNCWVPQDLVGQNREDLVFENAWKRTPMLQEITLEYLNRTTTRGGRTVLPR